MIIEKYLSWYHRIILCRSFIVTGIAINIHIRLELNNLYYIKISFNSIVGLHSTVDPELKVLLLTNSGQSFELIITKIGQNKYLSMIRKPINI